MKWISVYFSQAVPINNSCLVVLHLYLYSFAACLTQASCHFVCNCFSRELRQQMKCKNPVECSQAQSDGGALQSGTILVECKDCHIVAFYSRFCVASSLRTSFDGSRKHHASFPGKEAINSPNQVWCLLSQLVFYSCEETP